MCGVAAGRLSRALPTLTLFLITAAAAAPAPAPAPALQNFARLAAPFDVQLQGDNTGQYLAAVDHAFALMANAWGSEQAVSVRVEFVGLNDDTKLGSARASSMKTVDGREELGLFQIGAAEKVLKTNLNPDARGIAAYDVLITVNQDIKWYLGTDASPSSSEFDLVSVLIHETVHGLGFNGRIVANSDTQTASVTDTRPARFDKFLANHQGCSVLAFANQNGFPSGELYDSLTHNNLFFATSSGNLVAKLYAPPPYQNASSVYHISTLLDGQQGDLLTPSMPSGYANHDIGPEAAVILDTLVDLTQSGAPECANLAPADTEGEPEAGAQSSSDIFGFSVITFVAIVAGSVFLVVVFVAGGTAMAMRSLRRHGHAARENSKKRSARERAANPQVTRPQVAHVQPIQPQAGEL